MPYFAPLLRCSTLLLVALLLPSAGASPRQVQAFNTYETSPYLNDDGQGLVPALVAHLNRVLQGQLHLQLRNLPRARLLQSQLKQPDGFDGIALLLHPTFIGDDKRNTYLWSKPLFDDYNVLVLPVDTVPTEMTQAWMKGKRLIAVRGQRLQLLDPLVAAGHLSRSDFNSEQQTIQMIAAGRGDFTQMNRLMFQHLAHELGLGDRLVAIPEPGVVHFQRHILVGKAAGDLLALLNAAIDALHCLPEWRQTAAHYGFAAMPCRSH